MLNSLRDVEPQVKFIMSDGGMEGDTEGLPEIASEPVSAQVDEDELEDNQ